MVDCSRVRLSGPLESYAAGFAAELARRGYSSFTATSHLQLLAHLSRWLAAEGLGESDLTPSVAERFAAARRAAGYRTHRTTRALMPLMSYLRDLGAAPPPPAAAPRTPLEELLERYRRYLVCERGLTVGTVAVRVRVARDFLAGWERGGKLDLGALTSAHVSGFVVTECRRRSRGDAKLMVGGLRSLLRFLQLDGAFESSLLGAVPSVAGWRLSGLPKALEPGQLERLLDSCDRGSVLGRRNLAILTLLARLGLRRGEVAALQLSDIDWRAGEIVVPGKGDRRERLPLPAVAGEAVAAYLRNGRPATALGRSVFVSVRAPHRALSPRAVGCMVARAGRRAGLGELGAHQLRHTIATELLRAGAPLSEIGQVLRHRNPGTTAIYAKVDREALRSLARPWPGDGA